MHDPASVQRRVASACEAALLHGIGTLGQSVVNARLEIAALRGNDITMSCIPRATDGLDAIVTLIAAVASKLRDATVRIYKACSFQDITGQRIPEVVATLGAIERTIARSVDTFGIVAAPAEPSGPSRTDGLPNGPQLPAAMDQPDIDTLPASFP